RDGKVHWVDDRTVIARDTRGRPTHYDGIVIDITERKEAEQALRESEERFRSLFENAVMGLYRTTPDGRWLMANPALLRMLGYSSFEELARHGVVSEATTRVYPRSTFMERVEQEGQVIGFEAAWPRADGSPLFIRESARVVRDQAGNTLYYEGTVEDITERKQAEAEREKLLADLVHRGTQLVTAAEVSASASTILDPEELMRQAADLIQHYFDLYYVGLFLVDETGEQAVLRAGTGQAGQKMLRAGHRLAVGGESMIGQCVAHAEARIALDVGEEAVRFNNPLLPETRSEMALPLKSRGKCIGALTVQSSQEAAFSSGDITALQSMADQLAIAIANARLYDEVQHYASRLEERVAERTAALAAVNRELEAFAYSVSHDLRAPLRSMDGFSQALLEDYADQLDAAGQDYLRRVRAGSQHMGQLIDDLLKLSRLTRFEMQQEKVDLSALAHEIAAELRRTQPERQVEFAIADGVVACGDTRLLRVVLENLLGNAWKFTGKQAHAKIEFGCAAEEGGPVYFVRDDGAGFDMAYAGRLFGAFQRLHSTAEFEGSGIGLATVQRITHRHGGRVWAEGMPNQGATFYFTLATEGEETA
ncbi:MAG: PAS domain S-box protein, partial [Anaerolineae bacterium]|nr:PAS domain S-box protein [Anaerolineae bacterium]